MLQSGSVASLVIVNCAPAPDGFAVRTVAMGWPLLIRLHLARNDAVLARFADNAQIAVAQDKLHGFLLAPVEMQALKFLQRPQGAPATPGCVTTPEWRNIA